MQRILGIVIGIALLACGSVQAQGTGKTELLWLGQAGFRIKTPGGNICNIQSRRPSAADSLCLFSH